MIARKNLERKLVGQINLPTGNVDITDPGYDRWVACRMRTKIAPGKYNCYAYTGIDRVWGRRVWINQIVFAEGSDAEYAEKAIAVGRSWRTIGGVGVDAGLAGFFNDKSDFGDDEWNDLCEWMWSSEPHNDADEADVYIRDFEGRDGFWTESGCGDGWYSVHAIRNNRKIVALEIRFF